MRNKLFLTLVLIGIYILVSINSFAAKVSGIVTDDKNEALIGAVVVLKNTEKGTQTDVDGRFELDGVEDGTYEILISMVTYKKTLQTITVFKGKDLVLDTVKLKEEGKTLTEVTVKSNKLTNTENAVLMEMRKSNVIVSGVSAQQISKTMDRNAADVVKRVPGVSIIEDRFIMVRGLYDRYNSVWLNDAGAPSSEIDKKSFSFDIIPSGQIDRILVYKTPAPELPGDFAGGMVKIYTNSIPDKNTYSAGLSFSSRQYATGKDFNYNERSKTDWLGYDDGMRSLPGTIAKDRRISKNDADIAGITKSFNNNWAIKTKKLSPDLRFNFSASNIFKIKKVKIGNTLAVNYSNTSTIFNTERKEWDDTTLINDYRDVVSTTNTSATFMDNMAVAWGNNKVEFKHLYNQIGTAQVLIRNNKPDTIKQEAYEKAYAMSYESRATYSTQLIGTHKSKDDSRKYTWALGYTDLFKNQPDLRRLRYVKNYGDDDSLYTAVTSGSAEPAFGGGRVYIQLHEKVYSFNHQFSQKLRIKNYEFEASAGNYIEFKGRAYNLRQFGYTLASNTPINEKRRLLRTNINQIFAEENVGGVGRFNIDEATNPYDQYDAKNQLIASFIALKLPALRDKLTTYGGLRYEYNKYTLIGYQNLNILNPEITTKFLLPSVNVSYNINPKQLVRVAYGKTLNRPEFRENSPFYFYDMENRWGYYGALYPSSVNTTGDTLEVAQIQNVDARWEWYPNANELIHAGVYYKHLKNPIQQVIAVPVGDARAYTFANLLEGYTYGLEIDMRKSLKFADDWFKTGFFKNLSFVGNMSLTKSEVTPGLNVKNKKTPIQGQSPYMYNAGLYYQNDSIGLQVSALYNVFGPRIFVLGQTELPTPVGNIWEMPFNSLDIVLSKKFFKYVTVTAGVQNLLNQRVRMAQDVNLDNKIDRNYRDAKSPDKSTIDYKPGRYFTFGVKVKL